MNLEKKLRLALYRSIGHNSGTAMMMDILLEDDEKLLFSSLPSQDEDILLTEQVKLLLPNFKDFLLTN